MLLLLLLLLLLLQGRTTHGDTEGLGEEGRDGGSVSQVTGS